MRYLQWSLMANPTDLLPGGRSSTATDGAGADTTAFSHPGFGAQERIGRRYRILNLLGTGGMGNVYRALDEELGEIVALKMIRPDLLGVPGALERFRREVRLARRVTHRNVARMFDIGEHGEQRFLTMEIVEGRSLDGVLDREGRLALDRAADLAIELCAGLAAAHRAGVIHRDLKPANVLIATDGHPVITDFGIARAEAEAGAGMTGGLSVGTPDYMAPEQVNALPDLDGRADLYALGVMLYEMVVGERPWQGPSDVAVVAARLIHPPPDPRLRRPSLPEPWARLILRLMATAREERPLHAEEVGDLLAALPSLERPGPRPPTVAALPTEALRATRSPDPTLLAAAPIFAPPAAAAAKTIAVLPFRNAGPPDDEYLADGLTDDLIDALSIVRGLRVRPRGVVVQHRGSTLDPRQIGAQLGVQAIVDGTVRRLGERVRVSVRIVSVADGFQLWAQRSDHPIADLFDVDDALARAVAAALTVDGAAAAREVPRNPQAVDLYLRARHAYHDIGPTESDRAVDLFREALAHAPGDPTILAGYAMACARRAFFREDGADLTVAAEIAERAIAAAPRLGEAYCARATVRVQQQDMAGAMDDLRQALARAPQLADAHFHVGRLLLEIAHTGPAQHHLEQAIVLDPHLALAHQELARLHALLGRPDAAEVAARRDPSGSAFVILARDAFWRGDRARAARLRQELPAGIPLRSATLLLLDATAAGHPFIDRPEAASILPAATERTSPRRRTFRAQIEAESWAGAGQPDEALAALGRAVDAGLIDLLWLDRCPLLEPLQTDPRFAALREAVARRSTVIRGAYGEGTA